MTITKWRCPTCGPQETRMSDGPAARCPGCGAAMTPADPPRHTGPSIDALHLMPMTADPRRKPPPRAEGGPL